MLFVLTALAAEPRWAGVPLERLPALSLGEADLSSKWSEWQAADGAGGWVRLRWYPDEAAATEAFAFQKLAASSMVQAPLAVAGADEAVGDGANFLLLRSRNVILTLRSADAGAGLRASQLLAALRQEGSPATAPAGLDATAWDAFGRRLADLR